MLDPTTTNFRGSLFGVAIFVVAVLGLCGGKTEHKDQPSIPLATNATTTIAQGCSSTAKPEPGLVITAQGAVRGARDAATYAYKGIAFAAPPLGPLRFRPPEAPPCHTGVMQATDYRSACLQLNDNKALAGDEDCLYLNVWTPVSAAAPRPVMFFIHGGGHIQGSASQRTAGQYLYDGAKMAERGDVIVVTTNYRLGAMGFLAHETLSAEGQGSSGNYGVLDNIAALTWVQKNIAAFGGDPGRVLIFGESAGAVQVCALVASPLAKGLFSRAIMESGGCSAAPLALRQVEGNELVKAAGCDAATNIPDCLRKLPAASVINARPGSVNVADAGLGSYGPAIDGYVLKGQPWKVIADGGHNKVPMIVGSNSDETSRSVQPVATCTAYEAAMKLRFAFNPDTVLRLYPCNAYATPTRALVAATSDVRFICVARRDLKALAKGQAEPVYRYFFTHAVEAPQARDQGAWHGLELLFVFQHTDIAGYRPSASELELSAAILKYWTRFAATGDPSAEGMVTWPRYEAARDPALILDVPLRTTEGVRTQQCDFWEAASGQIP